MSYQSQTFTFLSFKSQNFIPFQNTYSGLRGVKLDRGALAQQDVIVAKKDEAGDQSEFLDDRTLLKRMPKTTFKERRCKDSLSLAYLDTSKLNRRKRSSSRSQVLMKPTQPSKRGGATQNATKRTTQYWKSKEEQCVVCDDDEGKVIENLPKGQKSKFFHHINGDDEFTY